MKDLDSTGNRRLLSPPRLTQQNPTVGPRRTAWLLQHFPKRNLQEKHTEEKEPL